MGKYSDRMGVSLNSTYNRNLITWEFQGVVLIEARPGQYLIKACFRFSGTGFFLANLRINSRRTRSSSVLSTAL